MKITLPVYYNERCIHVPVQSWDTLRYTSYRERLFGIRITNTPPWLLKNFMPLSNYFKIVGTVMKTTQSGGDDGVTKSGDYLNFEIFELT